MQPEKWDSLSRIWRQYVCILGAVDLLMIDEIHLLDEDRGAILGASIFLICFNLGLVTI